MSYAEDEGLDTYPVDEFNDPDTTLEDFWNVGIHRTKDGEIIPLKNLTTGHLKNTINYFKNRCNTSILESELTKRNYF